MKLLSTDILTKSSEDLTTVVWLSEPVPTEFSLDKILRLMGDQMSLRGEELAEIDMPGLSPLAGSLGVRTSRTSRHQRD